MPFSCLPGAPRPSREHALSSSPTLTPENDVQGQESFSADPPSRPASPTAEGKRQRKLVPPGHWGTDSRVILGGWLSRAEFIEPGKALMRAGALDPILSLVPSALGWSLQSGGQWAAL